MKDQTTIKAGFKKLTVAGDVQLLFVLHPESVAALPWLASHTATVLELSLASPQEVLPVDAETGEVLDGQASIDELAEEPKGYEYPVRVYWDDPETGDAMTVQYDSYQPEGFERGLDAFLLGLTDAGAEYTLVEGFGKEQDPEGFVDLGDEADNDVAALEFSFGGE